MNKILEMLETALSKNEFKNFLLGQNGYNIDNRDGFFTDISAVLYGGVYKHYETFPEKQINILFEQEINKMLSGSNFETMCAFDYCWRQISNEEHKQAPFVLSDECLKNLKNAIMTKAEALKKYKDYFEFGSELELGAYQYVININDILMNDYGRKIL